MLVTISLETILMMLNNCLKCLNLTFFNSELAILMRPPYFDFDKICHVTVQNITV